MPLIEELEASGKWLFRWRSYLPLSMLVLAVASLKYFRYPFGSASLDQVWEWLCLLIGFLGLLIRGLVAAYAPPRTSGRSTTEQVADSLNTKGMYSIVRNPLYLGNFFIGLAIALYLRVWWVPLIYLLSFLLYYERIVFAEEMFLRSKFGGAYLTWASRTPAFFPKLSGWEPPSVPLSLRILVKREYQSAYALVLSLFVLELLGEFHIGHGWHVKPMWQGIVALATASYLVVRVLRKTTGVLRVEGR